MLNIAILGCGRIGQVHAATIKSMTTARVTAVADAFPDPANALAKTLRL